MRFDRHILHTNSETMKKAKDEDIFQVFNLDSNDPFTISFVERACNAVAKLEESKNNCLSPDIAFDEFVEAWTDYSYMPENSQKTCECFFNIFYEMWREVALAKVNVFLKQCSSARKGDVSADDSLCLSSMQITNALASTNGDLPEATQLFATAIDLTKDESLLSHTCIALLYCLCARLWRWSLSSSQDQEESMLMKGFQHHLKADWSDSIVYATEQYAYHISANIHSLMLYKQMRNENDRNINYLVKEAYRMLRKFDSLQVKFMREQFYLFSNIRQDDFLTGPDEISHWTM